MKEERIIKYLTVTAIVFFTLWGIYDIIIKNYDFVTDRFLEAAIAVAALLLYKRMHLSLSTMIVATVPVILHSLGLYSETYFGIPFDLFLHFTAGVAIAMIFAEYLYHYEGDKRNHYRILFFSVLIAAGFGSCLEVVEWLGFSIWGQGGGILFYGAGDHGGWSNASMDMIANTVGAVFGYLVMFLRKR